VAKRDRSPGSRSVHESLPPGEATFSQRSCFFSLFSQSLAYTLEELLTLFRERVNKQSALARELAAASYAVYIIRIFPVLGLQLAPEGSPMPPLAKFGVVAQSRCRCALRWGMGCGSCQACGAWCKRRKHLR